MASGIFKRILQQEYPDSDWRVESAGTWALVGEPPAAGSQAVMGNRDIEIGDYRARNVSDELLHSFDLILTMESGQKESLCVEFPDLSDRIYLLSEMINQITDIEDPYGGTFSEYEETASEIENILLRGFEKIVKLATSNPAIG